MRVMMRVLRPVFLFLVEGTMVDFMHGADSGMMRDKIGCNKN